MAQKTNPIILRVHKTKYNFDNVWFNYNNYASLLIKIIKIKNYISFILKKYNFSSGRFLIQISYNKTKITVFYCIPNKTIYNTYILKNIYKKKTNFRVKNNFLNKLNLSLNEKNVKNNTFRAANNKKLKLLNYLILNKKNNKLISSTHSMEQTYNFKNKKNIFLTNLFDYKLKLNIIYLKYFLIKYFNLQFFLNKKICPFNFSLKKKIYLKYFLNNLILNFFNEKKLIFKLIYQKLQKKILKQKIEKQSKNASFFFKLNKKTANICFFLLKKNFTVKYYKIIYIYSRIQFFNLNSLLKNKNFIINNFFFLFYYKYYKNIILLKNNNFFSKMLKNKKIFLYLQKYNKFFFLIFKKYTKNKLNTLNKYNFVYVIFFFNFFIKFLFYKINYFLFNIYFFKKMYLQNIYTYTILNKKSLLYNNTNFKKNIFLYNTKNIFFLTAPSEKNCAKKKNLNNNFNFFNNKYIFNFQFKNYLQKLVYSSYQTNVFFYFFKTNNLFASTSFLMDFLIYNLINKVTYFKLKNIILKNIIIEKKLKIKGIKIILSGVFSGKSKKAQKKKKISFKYGETSLHVFSSKIDFKSKYALTNFGMLGIKIWICYC